MTTCIHHRRLWSAADDAIVERDWGKRSPERLAMELKRTVTAVMGRMWVLTKGRRAKRGRFFTPAEDAILLAMRKQGMTFAKIGAALNRTSGSVVGRFWRLEQQRLKASAKPAVRNTPSLPRLKFLEGAL